MVKLNSPFEWFSFSRKFCLLSSSTILHQTNISQTSSVLINIESPLQVLDVGVTLDTVRGQALQHPPPRPRHRHHVHRPGVHLVRMMMMMMMMMMVMVMVMMMMKCSPDKRGFSPQLHLLLGAQLVQDLELVRGLGVASVHLQSTGRYYPAVTPAARTW